MCFTIRQPNSIEIIALWYSSTKMARAVSQNGHSEADEGLLRLCWAIMGLVRAGSAQSLARIFQAQRAVRLWQKPLLLPSPPSDTCPSVMCPLLTSPCHLAVYLHLLVSNILAPEDCTNITYPHKAAVGFTACF